MPFVPEISAEFSVPPEFSSDVLEKDLSTGLAQTSHLQITNQILFHCATASFYKHFCGIYYQTFRPQDFPAESDFTGRDFPAVSVVNGGDVSAVSAVTGCGIFRRFL